MTSIPRICSVPGCDRPYQAKDLCLMHYKRVRATGTAEARVTRGCNVEGCGRGHYGLGHCERHYRQAYYQKNKNHRTEEQRKSKKESDRNYYVKNRTEIAKKNSEYQRKNRDRRKLYLDEYNSNNRERARARNKKYRLTHPEVDRRHNARRRARLKGSLVEYFTEQDVLNLYGTNCHICLKEIDMTAPRSTRFKGWEQGLHLDHVIPISRGGTHTLDNVKPSHGICNTKKNCK